MSLLDSLRTKLADILAHPEVNRFINIQDFSSMMLRMAQIEYGTYTGTGAGIVVSTHGDPLIVLLIDATQNCALLHIKGMTDAHGLKIITAGIAMIAADGITLGTDSFTIGADVDINTAADVGHYLVIL